MPIGHVKWFDKRKGYGFIEPDDGSGDLFVHYTAIVQTKREFTALYTGDKVKFEVEDGRKGPQAAHVRIIEKAPRSLK
ncbi:MAG: cold-shock protein [Candidatus Lokiarchaeota archaeon]|nr:cold-shock protein [Candidatus Lokiarchaeota archaeon]